ncbi:hypothetical protein ANCDUO_09524 [Ancylostoma duodenale]|uniref:Uncharacterized protein n=1 Tax=Ancylostoma duodenale TaxID=51022 RepID=A0A0C2GGC8_9BILA|nr:hypothetical protein ANCDUO_09524 [Ancylostoma duodenale]
MSYSLLVQFLAKMEELRRLNVRCAKIYRTVVRPVALSGAECWPVTKETERRISINEMRMLRWMGGITQL